MSRRRVLMIGLSWALVAFVVDARGQSAPQTYKGLEVVVASVTRATNVSLTDCPAGANIVRGVIRPGDENEFASVTLDFKVQPSFKPVTVSEPGPARRSWQELQHRASLRRNVSGAIVLLYVLVPRAEGDQAGATGDRHAVPRSGQGGAEIADPTSVSLRTRGLQQRCPIDGHRDRQDTFGCRVDQKTLTVSGDVVLSAGVDPSPSRNAGLHEDSGLAHREAGTPGLDVNRNQLLVRRHVVQLTAVTPPERLVPAILRDLPPGARDRQRLHPHLVAAGVFIRDIRYPLAIR